MQLHDAPIDLRLDPARSIMPAVGKHPKFLSTAKQTSIVRGIFCISIFFNRTTSVPVSLPIETAPRVSFFSLDVQNIPHRFPDDQIYSVYPSDTGVYVYPTCSQRKPKQIIKAGTAGSGEKVSHRSASQRHAARESQLREILLERPAGSPGKPREARSRTIEEKQLKSKHIGESVEGGTLIKGFQIKTSSTTVAFHDLSRSGVGKDRRRPLSARETKLDAASSTSVTHYHKRSLKVSPGRGRTGDRFFALIKECRIKEANKRPV